MDGQMQHNNMLAGEIDLGWEKFIASLAGLSEQQLTQIYDELGWSIKDHLAHIAAWEEICFLFFHGIPTEETMRVPPGKYAVFDDTNEDIRNQWASFSLDAIQRRLHRVHRQLMEKVSPLSEEDLQQLTGTYFANAADFEKNRKRTVETFIRAHCDYHYPDHIACIQKLVAASLESTQHSAADGAP